MYVVEKLAKFLIIFYVRVKKMRSTYAERSKEVFQSKNNFQKKRIVFFLA